LEGCFGFQDHENSIYLHLRWIRSSFLLLVEFIGILFFDYMADDVDFFYVEIFTTAGFSVTFVPLLEFVWTNQDKLKSVLLKGSSQFEGLIVTSPRAMEALGIILHELRSSTSNAEQILKDWTSIPLFVVVSSLPSIQA
jgi:hypothetical protein